MTNKCIYLAGPTSGGKTALSVELAKQLPGAVLVNGDSIQAHRGLPLLAATPSIEELEGTEHRLFAVLDPKDSIRDNEEFTRLVVDTVKEVANEGKTPIIVSGGRYLTTRFMHLAHGIDINPYQKHGQILKDPTGIIADPDFPLEMATVLLMPRKNVLDARITNRFNAIADPHKQRNLVLKEIKEFKIMAAAQGIKIKDATVAHAIGTGDFVDFLKGKRGGQEVLDKVIHDVQQYAGDQLYLFKKIHKAMTAKSPDNIIRLNKGNPSANLEPSLAFCLHFMDGPSTFH